MINYYDYMTVEDLKSILEKLPDEMQIVIPVVDEDNVNHIYGFRRVRTAGILFCEFENPDKVFCLNGSTDGYDLDNQVNTSGRDVNVTEVLYGGKILDDD